MELKSYYAQDKNGEIVAGAYIYLYEKDKTSLATGIKGADGKALPNPFNSDEDGLFQLAAPNGVYDLRVSSSGRDNTIRVQFFDAAEAVDTVNTLVQRAEEAKDTAQLSAGLFDNAESGISGTTEGQYFSTPSSDSAEHLVLYRHDPGNVATPKSVYPSGAALTGITERIDTDSGTEALHVFADSEGKHLMSIEKDGAVRLQGAQKTVQDGIAFSPSDSGENEYLHQWADHTGNTVLALRKDGALCTGARKPLQDAFAGADVVTGLEYRAQNNEDLARLYFDKGKYGSRVPFRSEKIVFGFNEDPNVSSSRFAQAVPITEKTGIVFFCQKNINFQSGSENAQRVCVRPYTLQDDGSIALGPITVVDEPALWSSGLGYSSEPFGLRLESGRIILMFRRNDNQSGELRDPADPPVFNIYSTQSDDDGVTWSSPALTVPHSGVDKAAAGQLIKTSTGRLIYPCYNGDKKIFSLYSDDDGNTWSIGNIITTTNLFTEPAIIEQSDGTLLILARMGYDFDRLFRGVFKSVDDGLTWTFEGENTSAAFTASNTALLKTDWNKAGFPKVIAGSSADGRSGTGSRTIYRLRFSYDDGETFVAEAAPFPDEQLTGYSHLSHISEDVFILAFETASPLSPINPEGDINTRNCTAIMIFNLAEVFKDVTHS